MRPSPSGGGRGDSTLPYRVSFRSATELTWGIKNLGKRQTSWQQRRRESLLTRRLFWKWEQLYGASNPNLIKKGCTPNAPQNGRRACGLPLNSRFRRESGSGKRMALLPSPPLRTHRAIFTAVGSSLSNALFGGRGVSTYDRCSAFAFDFANDARCGFNHSTQARASSFGAASSSRRIPVLCIIVKVSCVERPRGS